MLKVVSMRRDDGERGAYAILFAILIVVLFIMAALAVDLSDARARVKENRTRVDFAGLAAGRDLLENGPWEACLSAWNYIRVNTPDFPTSATSPCDSGDDDADPLTYRTRYCSADPLAVACEAVDGLPGCDPNFGYEYYAAGEDPYEVIFTYPVTDAQLDLLSASGRTVDGEFDGAPCERFAVTMVTDQGSLFGGIVGNDGIQAPATAVVRAFTGDDISEIAALIILDPVACNVLTTGGNTNNRIEVHGSQGLNDEGEMVHTPGIIAVDSLANGGTGNNSCLTGNRRAIDANNNNNNYIEAGPDPVNGASGLIVAYGMSSGQTNCSTGNPRICDPDDILAPARLRPVPIPIRQPVTRRPVDHRYNCNAVYPTLGIPSCENATLGSVSGTADGTNDYIDQLRRAVGTTGMPDASRFSPWWPETMTAFQDFLTDPGVVDGTGAAIPTGAGARCQPNIARIRVPAGNWYVNCPGPNGFNPGGTRVDFEGAAGANVVVFENAVQPGDALAFNVADAFMPLDDPDKCPAESPGPAQPPGVVYIRNANLQFSGPQNLLLCNATAYVANGTVDTVSSGTTYTWIAPFSGPFEDLALWSERADLHRLGGQTALNLEGVFFTPNATPFNFAGQPVQTQTKAQFFTYRLDASGQGALIMAPDPARSIPTPFFGHYLIR